MPLGTALRRLPVQQPLFAQPFFSTPLLNFDEALFIS
jgi:hypothetical protein